MGRYSDSSDDAVGEYYQAQNWRKEGAKEERERIIKLLHQELADGFAKAFVIGLIIGEPFPHAGTAVEEKTDE